MRKLRALAFTLLSIVTAAAVAAASSAYTAEVSFSASSFIGGTGSGPTGEAPPQAEVHGTFTVSTDAPHDLADEARMNLEPGPFLETYTSPLAVSLEIAGKSYAVEEVQVLIEFFEGQAHGIMIGGRYQYSPDSGPVVHVSTATTNDFILWVSFPPPPDQLENFGPARADFVYTTEGTVSGFNAQALHVTVTSDSGPPFEFDQAPPVLVADATLCANARAVPGAASLDGSARPGRMLCTTGDGGHLRDARVAAATAAREARTVLPGRLTLATALGSANLVLGKADRVMLAANTADQSDAALAPADGAAYRCSKARATSRRARIPRVSVAGAPEELLSVGAPTRLCVGKTGMADLLLCYAAKPVERSARPRSTVWVAHALGKEELRVAGEAEICLPTSTAREP